MQPENKRPDQDPERDRLTGFLKTASLWALIVLIPLALFQLMESSREERGDLTYTRFRAQVAAENVTRVTIRDGQEVQGELESPIQVRGEGEELQKFRTRLPAEPSQEFLDELVAQGVEIEATESGSNWVSILVTALPWVLIIGLWIFFIRQMQGGGSRAFSFGKSKAKLLSGDTPQVTFADVAGCDEAKEELEEIIEFLKDPGKFSRLGGRLPKGALLVGPPGTGKTLLARAVAGEAGRPFFSMSGSDFVEMFVGVGASVTGDTPVLIRDDAGTRLVPIGEYVDGIYEAAGVEGEDGGQDRPVRVSGTRTLGYQSGTTGFRGSLDIFGGSAWSDVRGVYRHEVDEIFEVDYLGGTIRTTDDHSVFVRGHGGIRAKAVRELEPGDVLVNLPFHVRGRYDAAGGTAHEARAHEFSGAPDLRVALDESKPAVTAAFAHTLNAGDVHSRRDLAEMVGVSPSTVGNWQAGRHLPRELSDRALSEELPDDVEVSPSLLRLMGYYTAEGRANGNLEFCFGSHESGLIAETEDLLRQVFGVEPVRIRTEDNTTRVIVYSAPLGRFFAAHCGNGSHHKRAPAMLWRLPREHFLAFLHAYAQGDGYTTATGKLRVTSVSRQLIRELTWLCALHGIGAGVRHQLHAAGRVIKDKPLPETESWTLIIGRTSNPFHDRNRDGESVGHAKRPVVRSVTRKPHDGYVYDLCGCENEAFFGGEKPVLLHNSRVRDLFEQGKSHAPCIIFIDEIDAVGRHRGAGLGGGHDEREQTLNQLLVEMDGFEANNGVILLAATNRPDVLDPALLRPGRFDRQIVVDSPDVKGREGILRVHTKEIPLAGDVDLSVLAKGTPGLSGADLENIVNEAALLAAREDKDRVYMEDMETAKDKVMLGAERKSMVISEEERRVTAYHEAGHAVIGLRVPGLDPLHKVTIVPRGRALGITASLPEEDRHNYTRQWLEGQLVMLFGGRVAEEMTFGPSKITTGAGNDIERATGMARRMVTHFGMSDAIGPMTVGERDQEVFVGKEISQRREVSQKTAELVDSEVKRILDEAYRRCREVLEENRGLLERIADALLERETLDAGDIERLDEGRALEPLPESPGPEAAGPDTEEAPSADARPGRRPRGDLGGGEPSPAPA